MDNFSLFFMQKMDVPLPLCRNVPFLVWTNLYFLTSLGFFRFITFLGHPEKSIYFFNLTAVPSLEQLV